MSSTEIIGIVAGIFTGASLLPQLIKILREKKSEDISILMLVCLMTGLIGWICYGYIKKDYPILITNGFSVLVNSSIIFLKYKYSRPHSASHA